MAVEFAYHLTKDWVGWSSVACLGVANDFRLTVDVKTEGVAINGGKAQQGQTEWPDQQGYSHAPFGDQLQRTDVSLSIR
jgi:hypothetical protein